jgi:hypothetical protein
MLHINYVGEDTLRMLDSTSNHDISYKPKEISKPSPLYEPPPTKARNINEPNPKQEAKNQDKGH